MYRSATTLRNKKLLRLYCIAMVAGFSLGIFPPLVSILMESRGVTTDLIGLTSSSYFITMALITPFASRCITRLGIKPVMLIGALITAVLSGCYVFVGTLELWVILRVLSGVGMGLFLVAGQTAVNLVASNENRTSVSTIYSVLLGVGFGVGPVFAAYMYSYGAIAAFLIASIVIALSVLIVIFGFDNQKPNQRKESIPGRTGLASIAIPLHFIFAYGVLESVMISLLPAIVINMGVAVESTGYPFFLFIFCSGFGMAILGWLETKLGKSNLLMLATLLGFVLLLMISLMGKEIYGIHIEFSFEMLLIACGLMGFCLGPMFPLVLSMIGEALDESELAAGSAWFTAMFSWGCGLGPILSSYLVMQSGNKEWFFLVAAGLFFTVLVHYQLKRFITGKRENIFS